MSADAPITIRPPGRWARMDLRELWRYRDLFVVFSWRDISVRYKQTALGVLWVVLQPMVQMVVFTAVFNRVGGIKSGDTTPYPVFVLVGLLFWQFFSGTLAKASDSMVMNANLVQKVYFPRIVIPTASVLSGLVDFLVAACILAAMMAFYHSTTTFYGVVLVPVLLLIAVVASLGGGMFLSALNVKYRDVRYALPFLIQTLMFVTPVIYPVSLLSKIPALKMAVLACNPIAGVIDTARATLLRGEQADWATVGTSALSACAFFVIGLYFFRAMERHFADII